MKRNYQEEVVQRLLRLEPALEVSSCGFVGLRKEPYSLYSVRARSDSTQTRSREASKLGNEEKPPLPHIFLSAGIHGDEPAGVYALLEFMKGPILDYLDRYQFSIFPCLNPWGFEYDRRENVHGVDINRSFLKINSIVARVLRAKVAESSPYLLAINMHEDDPQKPVEDLPLDTNPRAFYLYETTLNGQMIGVKILKKLREEGIDICLQDTIYGEGNQGGIIFSHSTSGELEQFLRKHTNTIITLETPTIWSLEERIRTHLLALKATLD